MIDWQEASALARQGGPVLVILVLLSIVTTTVVLAKLWQFARAGILLPMSVDASRQPAPIAAVIGLVDGDADRAQLEPTLDHAARIELAGLGRGLKLLETMGSLGPLLGLLGTVLGMIRAFSALSISTGRPDPALLAGGIAEALLNTAGGLIVAIVATTALTAFEARIERCHLVMEAAAERALRRHRVAA